MNKEDSSQETESPNRVAVEILKALGHYEYPEDINRVEGWLEETTPLRSLVKSLCQKDKTGQLTFECVHVILDLMANEGETVSPAIWDVLNIVEEDEVRFFLGTFIEEPNPKLKKLLFALVTGVSTYGEGLPRLQVWCEELIQALEDKKKFKVLLSVSEVALKLLYRIVFPHSRKAAFSVFERLIYPMPSPYLFNLVLDHLLEVLSAVENDNLRDRFCGLIKALLERFPPAPNKETTYRKLQSAMSKYPNSDYEPKYALWKKKSKSTTELSSILECPVCYERFATPIRVCENGHCICNNCKMQMKNCPICRGNISNIRMTIIDQIMEATEFSCKNFDAGCDMKLPYKDIWVHEVECEYRTVACDIITSHNTGKLMCNEDVVVARFHDHIEKSHKALVTEFELNAVRRGELRRQKANEIRLLKSSDRNLNFIERIYVTDEEIFFSYHYIGKSEDANNYVYTIKIYGGEVPQKIRYTNFCLPNYMKVFNTEVDERCLVLEPEKLFSDQETKFEYFVKIEDVKVYRMRARKNKFLALK